MPDKIGIMGCGALGSYAAAFLTKEGEEMTTQQLLDTDLPFGLSPEHLVKTGEVEVVTVPNFKPRVIHDDFD